ncbi:hypothetical protein BDR26DRAFT_325346 [Obelidium mucronatum]|nr:hypothetical protein BDR26DRAFT_325346 [Obelidium mucronatum]
MQYSKELATVRDDTAMRTRSDLDALEKLAQESENMHKEEVKRLEKIVKDLGEKNSGLEAVVKVLEQAVESANLVLTETNQAFGDERRELLDRIEALSAKDVAGAKGQEDVMKELARQHRITVEGLNRVVEELNDRLVEQKKNHDGVVQSLEARVSESESKLKPNVELLKAKEAKLVAVEAKLQETETASKTKDSKLKEADGKVKEVETKLKDTHSALTAKESLLKEYESQVKAKEMLLKERDTQLKERDSKLKAKDALIQSKEAQLKERDIQLKERDVVLKEKESDLKKKEEVWKDMSDQLKAKEAQLQEQQSRLKTAESQLKTVEAQIRAIETKAVTPASPGADSGLRQRKKGGKGVSTDSSVATNASIASATASKTNPSFVVQNVCVFFFVAWFIC